VELCHECLWRPRATHLSKNIYCFCCRLRIFPFENKDANDAIASISAPVGASAMQPDALGERFGSPAVHYVRYSVNWKWLWLQVDKTTYHQVYPSFQSSTFSIHNLANVISTRPEASGGCRWKCRKQRLHISLRDSLYCRFVPRLMPLNVNIHGF